MAFLALCRVLLGYYALLYKRKEEDYGCKENRRFSKSSVREESHTGAAYRNYRSVRKNDLTLGNRNLLLPDVSVYVELCEILGISLNEFLAGEDIEIANVEKNRKTPLIQITKDSDCKTALFKAGNCRTSYCNGSIYDCLWNYRM